MTVQHSSLTGADLHEPKGVSGASANTVYKADGAGSGDWEKIGADSIDTSSIFNSNKFKIVVSLADISTASSIRVPLTNDCTLNKITSVISGAITTADNTITVTNAGGGSLGTITITQSGSAEGDMDSLEPSANNVFTADTWLKIATDGASDTAVEAAFVLDFTYNG